MKKIPFSHSVKKGLDIQLVCGGGRRDYIHVCPIAAAALELHDAVLVRIQRVIAADAHIEAGIEFSTALPHDDAARCNGLAAEAFYSKTLRI